MNRAQRATLAACALALANCTLPQPVAQSAPAHPWQDLFDGASTNGLTATQFGGEGPIHVVDSRLVLEPGSPLTGVHCEDFAAADCYELELHVTKLGGPDFFCGLTFPIDEAHMTLILGGWGGMVCGLSCIDGDDAAANATRRVRTFHAAPIHTSPLA